jgi:hypothetical protein
MTIKSTPIMHVSPQLPIGDAERVAEWCLRHLGPEQRGQMMADMPTVYARVFPGVDPEAILRNVRAALARIAQEQADAFAAVADKHLAYAGRKHTGHFHDPSGRYDYCADPACPRLKARLRQCAQCGGTLDPTDEGGFVHLDDGHEDHVPLDGGPRTAA